MTRIALGIGIAAMLAACNPQESTAPGVDAEEAAAELADVEAIRLAAFVAGDWELLDQLHADDFELVNPAGRTFTKAEYLDPMTNGAFRYLVFEPEGEIRASVHGDAGAVRYQSRLSVRVGENILPEGPYRHTDYYERREGRWQVVFSQATPVQAPLE